MESIKKFYVTFGQKSPFRNGYVLILVRDEDDDAAYSKAREEAFRALGDEWSNIYPEAKFINNVEIFPAGKLGSTIQL